MVRKWSTLPISLSYTTPHATHRRRGCARGARWRRWPPPSPQPRRSCTHSCAPSWATCWRTIAPPPWRRAWRRRWCCWRSWPPHILRGARRAERRRCACGRSGCCWCSRCCSRRWRRAVPPTPPCASTWCCRALPCCTPPHRPPYHPPRLPSWVWAVRPPHSPPRCEAPAARRRVLPPPQVGCMAWSTGRRSTRRGRAGATRSAPSRHAPRGWRRLGLRLGPPHAWLPPPVSGRRCVAICAGTAASACASPPPPPPHPTPNDPQAEKKQGLCGVAGEQRPRRGRSRARARTRRRRRRRRLPPRRRRNSRRRRGCRSCCCPRRRRPCAGGRRTSCATSRRETRTATSSCWRCWRGSWRRRGERAFSRRSSSRC
jgi:hypothetical protein